MSADMTGGDESGKLLAQLSRKAKKTSEPDRNVTALREIQISVAQVGLVCRVGCAQAVAERRSSCAARCSSNKITVTHSTRPQRSATVLQQDTAESVVVKT
jgi:hypothetical protein